MSEPIPEGFMLKEAVAQLGGTLLSRHPSMPSLLQQIHKTLKQYPEQVTLMTEEEIQIIVKGLELQTQTFLASSVVSKSKAGSKSLQSKLLNEDAL